MFTGFYQIKKIGAKIRISKKWMILKMFFLIPTYTVAIVTF